MKNYHITRSNFRSKFLYWKFFIAPKVSFWNFSRGPWEQFFVILPLVTGGGDLDLLGTIVPKKAQMLISNQPASYQSLYSKLDKNKWFEHK